MCSVYPKGANYTPTKYECHHSVCGFYWDFQIRVERRKTRSVETSAPSRITPCRRCIKSHAIQCPVDSGSRCLAAARVSSVRRVGETVAQEKKERSHPVPNTERSTSCECTTDWVHVPLDKRTA